MTKSSTTINKLINISDGIYAYESDLTAPPNVTESCICKTMPFYDNSGVQIGTCSFNPCDDDYGTWEGQVNGRDLREHFWMHLNDDARPDISQFGETLDIDGDTEDDPDFHGKRWRVYVFRGCEVFREELLGANKI